MDDYFELDKDGYPEERWLEFIRNFDHKTMPINRFIEIWKDNWWQSEFSFIEKRPYRGVKKIIVKTGGWSGNEETINEIVSNPVLVVLLGYQQWTRGGEYVFEVPITWDHNSSNQEQKETPACHKESIEEWEGDVECNVCGETDTEMFSYKRTVANGEIWMCGLCGSENLFKHKPEEGKPTPEEQIDRVGTEAFSLQHDGDIYIPENSTIQENGYYSLSGISDILRKYKNCPEKIQFIADMLE